MVQTLERHYKPGKGVKPSKRTHRYLAEPIDLVLEEVECYAFHNTHYRHTSRLRAVFGIPPEVYERLVSVRDLLPVTPSPEGRQTLLPRVLNIHVLKTLDAELSSYGHQGSLAEVTQRFAQGGVVRGERTMRVGDRGKAMIRVTGTSDRGLMARLISFEVPGRGLGYLKEA